MEKLRIIRSIRLGLAMIVCFMIAHMFHISHSLWICITLVVVLFDQATVGGAIFRGFLRTSATLIAAFVGVIVLYIFHESQLANEVVIVIGTTIYAYLFMDSKYSYIGVLGSITLIIVLANDSLLNTNGVITSNDLSIPLMRALAIIIGTLVAIISIITFFPQYAKHNIKIHIADSLNKIENTIRTFTNQKYSLTEIQEQVLVLEAGLMSNFNKFIKLADEMRYETKVHADYTSILLYLRRINRLLYVVFHDFSNEEIRNNLKLIHELEYIADTFKALRAGIANENLSKEHSLELELLYHERAEIKSSLDYEMVFIYSIVNRIIHETKQLICELEKI